MTLGVEKRREVTETMTVSIPVDSIEAEMVRAARHQVDGLDDTAYQLERTTWQTSQGDPTNLVLVYVRHTA